MAKRSSSGFSSMNRPVRYVDGSTDFIDDQATDALTEMLKSAPETENDRTPLADGASGPRVSILAPRAERFSILAGDAFHIPSSDGTTSKRSVDRNSSMRVVRFSA